MPTIALDSGLDLRKLTTTGSTLQINEDYNNEIDHLEEPVKFDKHIQDTIGEPVESFELLAQQFVAIDESGYVKKRIVNDGGGLPISKDCTIYVVYSGYFEGEQAPFDTTANKPLVMNLQESGLLPGLQIAIESLLVGEMAVFLLSYKVMYGELGVPPRIKPKADCVFYIKLIKSVLTPPLNFSEDNIFHRVNKEINMLYMSGVTLHKSNNSLGAIQLFKKAVNMWYRCRLANEEEELKQTKSLVKLYTNLAICYNLTKQPLRSCIACNELHRLNKLWNNGKALFQNGKALRMIGQFDESKKRLKRAAKLCPDNKDKIEAELSLIDKAQNVISETELADKSTETVSDCFKEEVNGLIKEFKENSDLCKLTLPSGLTAAELQYINEVCLNENLLCDKVEQSCLLNENNIPLEAMNSSGFFC